MNGKLDWRSSNVRRQFIDKLVGAKESKILQIASLRKKGFLDVKGVQMT